MTCQLNERAFVVNRRLTGYLTAKGRATAAQEQSTMPKCELAWRLPEGLEPALRRTANSMLQGDPCVSSGGHISLDRDAGNDRPGVIHGFSEERNSTTARVPAGCTAATLKPAP